MAASIHPAYDIAEALWLGGSPAAAAAPKIRERSCPLEGYHDWVIGAFTPVERFEPIAHLNLGGIEIRPPLSFAFDMKPLGFKGTVDGILGFPLFGKFIVEIDYPGSRVRIFHPDSYRPSPHAAVLPLRMTTGPIVRGSIRVRGKEAIEADMQLDTGSAHILTLCSPFVDRHQLLDSADELVPGTTRGFGGAAVGIAGRIEEVRIGPFAAKMPIVRFARQTTGSFGTERHYSANLGGEFMKAYKVIFDIPGSRLFLENEE